VGFETFLVYILYHYKKKVMFFQCGILNPLEYILLCFQEEVIFSMWDSKSFRIYTLFSQEKKLCFFNVG
jgi:hypothetical protein